MSPAQAQYGTFTPHAHSAAGTLPYTGISLAWVLAVSITFLVIGGIALWYDRKKSV